MFYKNLSSIEIWIINIFEPSSISCLILIASSYEGRSDSDNVEMEELLEILSCNSPSLPRHCSINNLK